MKSTPRRLAEIAMTTMQENRQKATKNNTKGVQTMEKDIHINPWANFIDVRMPPIIRSGSPFIYPDDLHDDMDLTVGGGRPEEALKKPRKPRRRKEVAANKFIVLRVSEDLYQKVRASSESTGTDISKWVRQAVLEQLSK